MKKVAFYLNLLALALLVGSLLPRAALAEPELDYDIPNGHFYSQGNGQGGAGGTGFAITDDSGITFWSAFRGWGGVLALGYPVSRRFVFKGLISQITQKAVLQWQPDTARVQFVNVFDELSAAGFDDQLWYSRQIPRPASFAEAGKGWDEIAKGRLALLDASPAIKARYFSATDPITFHGLPTSAVEDFGTVYVIRCQRTAFQQWRVDTPWAAKDVVTLVNGGDIAKELGLFDAAALLPEAPPLTAPATALAFSPYSDITWEPNCGLTQVKIYLMDVNGDPIDNMRFRVETEDGGWGANSNPTGSESYKTGWTDFVLANEAMAKVWNLWVIDANGNRVSPVQSFATDNLDCRSRGSGHQVATVRWKSNYTQGETTGWALWDALPTYQYQFSGGVSWSANCGLTQVKMYVKDTQSKPVSGVRFHIETDGWGKDSFRTGTREDEEVEERSPYPPGWTDFALAKEMLNVSWRLWVIDDSGNRVSPVLSFTTNDVYCEAGGIGHQIATVHWTKKF